MRVDNLSMCITYILCANFVFFHLGNRLLSLALHGLCCTIRWGHNVKHTHNRVEHLEPHSVEIDFDKIINQLINSMKRTQVYMLEHKDIAFLYRM